MREVTVHSDNNITGCPILFFIHGWPDTGALFEKQVRFFSEKYRCVTVTLPGFDADGESLDFPELVDQLAFTIRRIQSESKQTTLLVGHDWGAYLTYLLDQKYPELATRLITLDVGAHFKPKNLSHALFMVGYQWWLVAAYFVGKVVPPVGTAMSRCFARYAHAPAADSVHSRMNYLYFYFWRARFCKKYQASLPRRYKPSKPMLFLYGKDKKYAFHSPRWEQIVESAPGSRVVGIEKSGHWFLFDKPELTNAAIFDWLKN